MPYSPTTWTDGVTPADQVNMNHLETQYTEATNSIEQDLLTPFVLSGLTAAKDGTIANQLDVAAGVALVKQTDNTLRRWAPAAQTFTTAVASTTYYLDLNPDGTLSWGTAHSTQANYLSICQVTTDASGNISGVADERAIGASMLAGMAGSLTLPRMYGSKLSLTSSTYDQLTLAANDQSWQVTIGQGDAAYGGGAGTYMYDVKNGGFVFQQATKSGITFGGTVNAGGNASLYSSANDAHLRSSNSGGWLFADFYNQLTFHNLSSATDVGHIDGLGNASFDGAVSNLGGQATAGSFGVPMIVGAAQQVHVTGTAQVTICQYTAPAGSAVTLRVSGRCYINNGTAGNKVSFGLSYFDADYGITTSASAMANDVNTVEQFNGAVSFTNGLFSISPLVVVLGAGQTLYVVYQDPTNAPNDKVTAIIERLN